MKRSYIGNRVFILKHGRAKLAHGPLNGHVQPLVRHLPSFDGSRFYRMVYVPHELRDFDRSMWISRRDKIAARAHALEIRAAAEMETELAEITWTAGEEKAVTSVVGTVDGGELFWGDDGRLTAASFGSEDHEPVERETHSTTRRSLRKDWNYYARLMC